MFKKKSNENKEIPKEELKLVCKEFRVSKTFVIVMAIVSISGFLGIISKNIFNFNIDNYVESFWFLMMSIGFIIESRPLKLFRRIDDNFDQRNFTSMTTLIVGLMALCCGILRFLGFQNITFSAVQGFISIIAIIFIIVET